MGRRWGKTFMAGTLATEAANLGAMVAWIAPTYGNSRPLWRFIETLAMQQPSVSVHKADRSIVMPSRGRVGIYTADNAVGMRGEAFDLVICDEAPYYQPDIWSDVIMPTLADRDGRAYLIGTPKGKNWFYTEYLRGLSDGKEQVSFTAPSSANPAPTIRQAAVMARGRVSDKTYRQEWLAEFVDDAGGVFRGVADCVREHSTKPQPNHTYVMGVDWGRSNDATVMTVMCIETAQVVAIDRMVDTAYGLQLSRLKTLYLYWNPYVILAEANSMGGPLVEALQRLELPVQAFMTTAISKPPLIDALALAIERGDIGITNNEMLINELQAYESERLPSGAVRYSAPAGMFDDHVISLALAWRAVGRGGSLILFEA